MKISREKVEANRARILIEAGRLFREGGLEKVSLGEVMRAAGLTHGGFYNHFASKDALIAAVLSEQPPADAFSVEEARAFAETYVSSIHRDNVADGCDFAGLGTEAVRLPAEARHGLTQRLKTQIDRLSPGSDGQSADDRRQAAIANWATMVGAVILARIADDPALADEILGSARANLRLAA